jgi:peptidoglycan/xylan/chitin deacetylase (PgdA/CDA1 family)
MEKSIRTAVLAVSLTLAAAGAEAADSAVVFMYHRFGEAAFPTTNIRLDQFEAHIQELTGGAYHVLPLPEIAAAIRAGRPLPDRTVGLSADDAYLSIYTEAFPRLKKAGLPFTLFVATEPIDHKVKGMMTWDQIREMAAAGVTIGGHSVNHPHMPHLDPAKQKFEIEESNRRFEAELGKRPEVFAYPFGEADETSLSLARESGAAAAFGQHSGVIHGTVDPFYFPRFALDEHYGDMTRFRQAANALALPVTDIRPADPTLRGGVAPRISFTVDAGLPRLASLGCYNAEGVPVQVSRTEQRVDVTFAKAPAPGRLRINCTLPAENGRWRWFGRQYLVAP